MDQLPYESKIVILGTRWKLMRAQMKLANNDELGFSSRSVNRPDYANCDAQIVLIVSLLF